MSVASAGRIARPALARRIAEGLQAGSVMLVAGPGYGKTMALEEAIELADRRSIWLGCREAGGEGGRLLLAAVQGLRAAVPGLADVLGDALGTAPEPVDVRSAASALLAELEHLLVEPLLIVFDDAEELVGDEAALALVDQLLGVRGVPVSLAIATRQPLPLKLAKLRASGRLIEIGPPELGFSAGECEELLRLRHGGSIGEDEVEAVVAASHGWPMGVALTGLSGSGEAPTGESSRDELFRYLAEEVFDGLDSEMRLALVDSSVPDALTPALIGDLGLPDDFLERAEGSGFFLRELASGARAYHPLFRDFLRERLAELHTEEERGALETRAAESLAGTGSVPEAIEHWLAAGRFEPALAALSPDGAGLVRASPGTVRRWLDAMPAEMRREPAHLLLNAQLLWGDGHKEQALEPLRAAVAGYRAAGDPDGEWLSRVFLTDTLVFLGAFDEVASLAEGWEAASGPFADAASTSVAWYEVVALSAVGRLEEAEVLRERLRADRRGARLFGFLDAISAAGTELTQGDPRSALARLLAEISELELHDPLGALPYLTSMVLLVRRTLGEREAALEWIDRCEGEAEGVGLGFVLRDFRLQRATLLAQTGDLSGAEVELARAGKRQGTGWTGVHDAEAEAHIARLRGDDSAAAAAALRALEAVSAAPMPWRTLATVEGTDILSEAGAPEAAREAIGTTLAILDEHFPAPGGRLHRAWLLASRAALEYGTGDPAAANRSLRASWEQAGGEAGHLLRANWPSIRPVLWHALAEGALTPDAVLPAMQEAFPGGEALVALVDHPVAEVRRDALLSALAAGHPAVLSKLASLTGDPDEQVAAAALATEERLRSKPPPLRFELLGRFRVSRAGWELDEASWQRPIAARIVRFLLIQESSAVPEDALFEAFWADKPADAARQNLAAAVSRARKVLDLPGAEESVIEVRERTYGLRLGERDAVDADQFLDTAAAALADRGDTRRQSLEAAAELWNGEPVPEDRYAEWSFPWRERLIETYSEVLSALIESHVRSGDQSEVIRVSRRLLEIDPLNEGAHRQLMLAYARTGRTSHALRQYLECRRALVVELGVEPSEETSQLQASILAGQPA